MNATELSEMTRILTGEASKEERAHFYNTIEKDPEKKNAFMKLEKDWITAGDAMLYKSLDVEHAWQRHKKEFLGLDENDHRTPFAFAWKWAAIIVIAVGLAFYFTIDRFMTDKTVHEFQTSGYETLPLVLEDGSNITLNENSALAYTFNKLERKVTFNGEGYFEIAPDADRPFIIEMDYGYIKVVGTAFNVKSEGSNIDVVVKEGVVEFGPKDRSEKTLLKAGASAKLAGDHLVNIEKQEPNSISWYTRELVFEHSPLSKVLNDVGSTYHINFQYDDQKFKNCHLTADFSQEELTDVLETLHTIFKVEFKKDNHTYIVTGEACE